MHYLQAFVNKQEQYEAMDGKQLIEKIFVFDKAFHDIKRSNQETAAWQNLKEKAIQIEDAGFQPSDDDLYLLSKELTAATFVDRSQTFSLDPDHAAKYKDGFHVALDKREDGLYAVARQKDGTLEAFSIRPDIAEHYRETSSCVFCGDKKRQTIVVPVILNLDPLEEEMGLSKDGVYIYEKDAKLYEKNQLGMPRFPEAVKAAPGLASYEAKLKEDIFKAFPENNPVAGVSFSFGSEDPMWLDFKTAIETSRPLTAYELMLLDTAVCECEKAEKVGSYSFAQNWDFAFEEVTGFGRKLSEAQDFADAVSSIPDNGMTMEQ